MNIWTVTGGIPDSQSWEDHQVMTAGSHEQSREERPTVTKRVLGKARPLHSHRIITWQSQEEHLTEMGGVPDSDGRST